MDKIVKIGLATLAVSVAACGPAKTKRENAVKTAPAQTIGETHSATGTVDNASGRQVTISHGPIKSLEWPAMTIPFTAKDAARLKGIKSGDRVAIKFNKLGNESPLIRSPNSDERVWLRTTAATRPSLGI